MFCCCFLLVIYLFLTIPVRPASTGPLAVDDHCEISCLNRSLKVKGRCRGKQFLLVISTELQSICISVVLSTELIRWTQAAGDAAGWAERS